MVILGLGDSTIFLQMYLGLAWTVGCVVFSTLVLHNSTECRIARQYLCQTAVFMCGLSILAFTVVSGNYHAYVMFAWIYGEWSGLYCAGVPWSRCRLVTINANATVVYSIKYIMWRASAFTRTKPRCMWADKKSDCSLWFAVCSAWHFAILPLILHTGYVMQGNPVFTSVLTNNRKCKNRQKQFS